MNLKPVLNIVFEGNISPLKVSLKTLGELLENIENLFLPIIQKKFPDLKKEDVVISLVNITEGSLRMGFSSSFEEALIKAYQDFFEISRNGKWFLLPPRSLSGLEGIAKFTSHFQCKAKISSLNGKKLEIEIPSDLSFTKEPIKEITSLYGKVIRVGGKEKITAQIEVPNEGLITVDLANENLARNLAQRLFEFVELEGELTWDPLSEKIIRFKAYDLNPFNPSGAWATIQTLSEEFGEYFNQIEDPVSYIKEIRGGD